MISQSFALRQLVRSGIVAVIAGALWLPIHDAQAQQAAQANGAFRFHLQEATIDDIQRAIRGGQITCRQLVQLYVNRAKAYNGTSDRLITQDGAPVPQAYGTTRAGSPLKFPVETV